MTPSPYDSLADLLEFLLVSYERMCALKRPPVAELDRHEQAIEVAFVLSAAGLKANLAPLSLTAPPYHRVRRVLQYIERGDSPKEATHRFFLVFRHKLLGADQR